MLYELSKVLDADKPDWRENSIIFMDNAGYNKKPEVKELVRKLRMPVIFSAKYAYDCSPCEFFFSYFK